jgi:FAD/FMN-containing dehydrogenase
VPRATGTRAAGEPPPLDAPAGFRGRFRTDADARGVYSEAAGIGRALPVAVAVPSDEDDVALLVTWARKAGHALIPRGSGSSMAGGAIGKGVVLDLSRLRRLDPVNVADRSVRGDAGVLRAELQRSAASVGFRFPVDPSSGEFCTIGGMAATNAAGPHSLRHGAMRPWVQALDCVFADGRRATIRRGEPAPRELPLIRAFLDHVHPSLVDQRAVPPSHRRVLKDSSGYAIDTYAESRELVDLLVGSEGTLAVLTSVQVALLPAAGATASLFVSFRELEHAVDAAVAARDHGASACELLDRTFLMIASKAGRPLPVSADAEAALLVEIEAPDAAQAMAEIDRLRAIFRSKGAVESIASLGPGHEAELWAFRHAASPAIARMDPALRSMQFIEDAAVPPDSLAAYVRGVRAALERNETVGVIFGHAGDAHVHVNPLIDVGRADWRQRVERILLDVTGLVARLGGTVTGEHGDGRLRTPLLDRVWTAAERSRFAEIKRTFDPDNVLNPGVKIPTAGQRAIDDVKYDLSLDALTGRARAALDTIERERGYARFRLDLV